MHLPPSWPNFLGALLLSLPVVSMASSPPQRPNIIVLESDDHHFAALGYMNPAIRTPNLDKLAARGVVFRRNICQGTMCAPSRNSLLTGTYPHNTGVYHNKDGGMVADVRTFPQALQRAGYVTALIGKNHFKPNTAVPDASLDKPRQMFIRELQSLGFDHVDPMRGKVTSGIAAYQPGFNSYQDYLQERNLLSVFQEDYVKNRNNGDAITATPSVLAEEHTQDAFIASKLIAYLDHLEKGKPFFIWTDFVAPHPPADAPQPYASWYSPADMPYPLEDALAHAPPQVVEQAKRQAAKHSKEDYRKFLAGYYAMVSALDAQIGLIVQALEKRGLLESTVIIFAGDQGWIAGDHGLFGKASYYDGSVRSPLLIAGTSRVRQGVSINETVELLDVAPTILDLAGIPSAEQKFCHGQSLLPFLSGEGEYRPKLAFAEEREWKMVFDGRYKYVRYPGQNVLFDLEADPQELHNLAGTRSTVEARLEAAIDHWLATTPPDRPKNPVLGKARPIDP